MIKKGFVIIVIFQLHSVCGQKSLEQLINEIPLESNYYSPFHYYDDAEKKQGISIQKEDEILKKLKLQPLKFGEYYITGKYEINHMLVLFFSRYWETENTHFALLFDESLKLIDRLDETAYSNAEGFYEVRSSIDYNIITKNIYNIYNRPNYLNKKYTITNKGFQTIHDYVVIKTPSGVRIREEPTTKSSIVGSARNLEVLNYLSESYELDSTVYDNGKKLKSNWIKVALKDSLQHLGYVYGAFAKRHMEIMTNEYKIVLNGISEEEFLKEETKNKPKTVSEKISDVKKILEILQNQLIADYKENEDFAIPIKIITDDGKEVNEFLDECALQAYFPKYHYLLLECGHSSDRIIDLNNGRENINIIGNPDYYLPSPQNVFRLNGFYSGQGNVHFLENNKMDGPEYLFSISSLLSIDYMEKYFWKDDYTLYLKDHNNYYRLKMRKLNDK